MELTLVVLGSAGVAALISSVINAVAMYKTKTRELATRELEFALGLARLKNEQLSHIGEAERAAGRAYSIEFVDPMMSVIQYTEGLKEYREKGSWEKARKAHEKSPVKTGG